MNCEFRQGGPDGEGQDHCSETHDVCLLELGLPCEYDEEGKQVKHDDELQAALEGIRIGLQNRRHGE